jgi:hypothetical protein
VEDARDLIGKTILVQLESNDGYMFTGVPEEGPFFCKVIGVDEIGMWVENQNFVTVEIMDSKGRFVPKEKQKPEQHVVNVLLPWRNVRTVVMYSEGEGEEVVKKIIDESGPDNGRIGFIK